LSFGRPKKRFSQNFLVDKNIAQKIVNLLELEAKDTVFEIGTGRGILTELLIQSGADVYSFELDFELVDELNKKFKDYGNVQIINIDFLKVVPSMYYSGKFKLVGNIPYDITSPVMNWLVTYRNSISCAVVTAQKELAERISSGPGSKNWAPISIFTQCYFQIKNKFLIPPKAFYPQPKVHSATMVLKPHNEFQINDFDFFEKIVRLSFKHRRKYLVNNLSELEYLDKTKLFELLIDLDIDKSARAEQISIEKFIELTGQIASIKNS
jgi:16S rRNA (adenine1518-N6/adenine1519-N6)-dimethyltransferase